MLLSVNDTLGYRVEATDGDVGPVRDVLFDEVSSRVRYLVIGVGRWRSSRLVLLSPAAFGTLQPDRRRIPTALTKQQVKDGPSIDASQSLPGLQEHDLDRYHRWTSYWDSSALGLGDASSWDAATAAGEPTGDWSDRDYAAPQADPHLRRTSEVIGYHVEATDGYIGHVEDLLIDEQDWAIHHLVINTRSWWPGRKVLVAPERLVKVARLQRQIEVDLTREQIKSSPGIQSERDAEPQQRPDAATRTSRARALLGLIRH